MKKSKLKLRLLVLASGTMLALGGCAGGGGLLPWALGAGLVWSLMGQQTT